MKRFFQFFMLSAAGICFGQSISDYGLIHIPSKFKDFKDNQYELNDLLASKLTEKKYIIVNNNSLEYDPCQVLNAEVKNTSNMLTNRLKIEFKDCKNVTIATFEGKSMIKDFEEGMQDALLKALKNVGSPKEIPTQQPQKNIATSAEIQATEKENSAKNNPAPLESKTVAKAEIYSNGTLSLNKMVISDHQFILANPNLSVPYAIFKATSKKEVYQVQLDNGSTTLGYLEDGKIVIDMPTADGNFKKEVFIRK